MRFAHASIYIFAWISSYVSKSALPIQPHMLLYLGYNKSAKKTNMATKKEQLNPVSSMFRLCTFLKRRAYFHFTSINRRKEKPDRITVFSFRQIVFVKYSKCQYFMLWLQLKYCFIWSAEAFRAPFFFGEKIAFEMLLYAVADDKIWSIWWRYGFSYVRAGLI